MNNNRFFIVLFALIFICHSAWALNSDSQQAAQFTSTHVLYNQKTGITVFTGNVKMDQGTTHLIADQLTIYTGNDGKIKKAVATGNLAHYSTMPDEQKKAVDVEGEIIEYYPQGKKAIVIGKALVVQGLNHFSGSHIEYDMEKQTVISRPTGKNSQSILILQPQDLPGKKQD